MTELDFTTSVRLQVIETARDTGRVPDAAEVAKLLGRPDAEVIDAFHRLADAHVYVLEPSDPHRIRMANPFSAVPTPFAVDANGRNYFGNCVWDALGILSLLGGDGSVETHCPDCREPLRLEVRGGRLTPSTGVVHFGVAARHWWDDIVHT